MSKTKELWGQPQREPTQLIEEALATWREVRDQVCTVATEQSLTRAEVARRSGVASPTLTQWLDGTYAGNYPAVSERLQRWLRQLADAASLPEPTLEEPAFQATRAAKKVLDALIYAQLAPEFVIVTMAPGMGKTTTARHFASTRSHAYLVTMRPTTASLHTMLTDIARALGVDERNPGRVDAAIGEALRRNGRKTLLMVDEAQNLPDRCVDQLRYFLDEFGCGVALLGNEEIHGRFGTGKKASGQIKRRIGKRVHELKPIDADTETLLDAWGITDQESRRLLVAIGRHSGALGHVDKTIKLASMLAAGAQQPLGAEHIRAAWIDRSAEGLAA